MKLLIFSFVLLTSLSISSNAISQISLYDYYADYMTFELTQDDKYSAMQNRSSKDKISLYEYYVDFCSGNELPTQSKELKVPVSQNKKGDMFTCDEHYAEYLK